MPELHRKYCLVDPLRQGLCNTPSMLSVPVPPANWNDFPRKHTSEVRSFTEAGVLNNAGPFDEEKMDFRPYDFPGISGVYNLTILEIAYDVPPNHPCYFRIFHEISKPSLGVPPFCGE